MVVVVLRGDVVLFFVANIIVAHLLSYYARTRLKSVQFRKLNGRAVHAKSTEQRLL